MVLTNLVEVVHSDGHTESSNESIMDRIVVAAARSSSERATPSSRGINQPTKEEPYRPF